MTAAPFPRSLLFVPANRAEMYARAWASEADAIMIDLEDSVPATHKAAARDALLALQLPDGWTRPIFVRVNSHGTENFAQDLRAVTGTAAPLAGVMLPKVESAAQVRAADAAIAACGRKGPPLALILLIETPGGVMRVAELADCGVARVRAFAFGAEDYRAGMRVDALDPALADFARASVSNAAAAAGLASIDAPLLQIDDPDAVRAAARRARGFGFTAKFAIHPSQVPLIHEAFTGAQWVSGGAGGAGGGDRAWALRAVEAYERAARDGHGSVALDGRMIDEATMKRARAILNT